MKFKFFYIFLFFLTSSCTNHMTLPHDYQVQFLPEKQPEMQRVSDVKVSYILPNSFPDKRGISGLVFKSNSWGRDTKQEKIMFSSNNFSWRAERRTDNGVAGSGVICTGDAVVSSKENNRLVTLVGKTRDTYQDGLIFPFPVPQFDLKSYLESAKVYYRLSANSLYLPNVVRSSFNRILAGGSNKNQYEIILDNALATITVDIDYYRSGSKVFIEAEISNMKPVNNIIDVGKNIDQLKFSIQKILNY